MWRFKPFMHKEGGGGGGGAGSLEGRSVDVGNLKIHIRNAIAEGGFSTVYLARDAVHSSKQYALKHMICNDQESLDLVLKEIQVMKSLRGHPNVVTLHAHTILDMGRTKEALLVMEFCDKSLVGVLESRGSAFFEEKQLLSMFRDVCNAVYAMHSQSPPIAHRDLKAENLLLAPGGLWKLCDFGSCSTNHKRFEKPEDMGVEEDNIRKHTTPAYRAPEMWDLFRKEIISEKVDIWALGCLLFRICYFRSAFDGESKLQILNGNYRIPELPKYSSLVTGLIRDMLQASPDDRPDITQVWFRVNEQLPVNLQKSLPDGPPELQSAGTCEGTPKSSGSKSSPMPHRSPPPPPSSGDGGGGGQLGAFWSTQHARESLFVEDKSRAKPEEASNSISRKDSCQPENHNLPKRASSAKEGNVQTLSTRRHAPGRAHMTDDNTSKDFEVTSSGKDVDHGTDRLNASKTGTTSLFQDDAFNTFVAEFDCIKLNSGVINSSSASDEALKDDVERLKEQLKHANMEKAEIASKFEKLSVICRSQRNEIQELKQALASRTSPSKCQGLVTGQPSAQEKSEWSTSSPEPKSWRPFTDEPQQPLSKGSASQSVRTKNSSKKSQAAELSSEFDSWGFGAESFTVLPVAGTQKSKPIGEGNNSRNLGGPKIVESQPAAQPAGWAGF